MSERVKRPEELRARAERAEAELAALTESVKVTPAGVDQTKWFEERRKLREKVAAQIDSYGKAVGDEPVNWEALKKCVLSLIDSPAEASAPPRPLGREETGPNATP